jgi:hypothetical protein
VTLELQLTWTKAQVSDGSGGSVLVQDIPEACLKTSRSDVASHPGVSAG